MQRSNYNETNGIIIGWEISRIFSEVILQEIDRKVISLLEEKNLRAADLARATKKSPVAVKKWLDWVSVPTADNLKVIARFLGVSDDFSKWRMSP